MQTHNSFNSWIIGNIFLVNGNLQSKIYIRYTGILILYNLYLYYRPLLQMLHFEDLTLLTAREGKV